MKLAEKIKQKNKTVYQRIAEKHGVSVSYVGKIATGNRNPTKKKGLEVLEDLQSLVGE